MTTLAKHLLKRKRQFKEGMEYIEDVPNKLKGVMRESDRKRTGTYEELYPQTQSAEQKRKKKKKGK